MRYATAGFTIAPSDTVDLPGATTAGIHVGVGGTITVKTVKGSVVTYTAASGTVVPVVATRVYSTGTAATSLVGQIGSEN